MDTSASAETVCGGMGAKAPGLVALMVFDGCRDEIRRTGEGHRTGEAVVQVDAGDGSVHAVDSGVGVLSQVQPQGPGGRQRMSGCRGSSHRGFGVGAVPLLGNDVTGVLRPVPVSLPGRTAWKRAVRPTRAAVSDEPTTTTVPTPGTSQPCDGTLALQGRENAGRTILIGTNPPGGR